MEEHVAVIDLLARSEVAHVVVVYDVRGEKPQPVARYDIGDVGQFGSGIRATASFRLGVEGWTSPDVGAWDYRSRVHTGSVHPEAVVRVVDRERVRAARRAIEGISNP